MAITKVQSVTGNGATLALNGVAAANALSYEGSLFRNPSTGAAFGTPTDTNGTLGAVSNDAPQTNTAGDVGTVIWAEKNTASGTHTVTPPTNSGHNSTLTEWSGCDTVNLIGVAASAKTAQGSQLSQVTGTTNGTPNSGDLALIALCLGDAVGGSNNIVLTDPVNANYTTLQLVNNSLTDLGTQHAFQVLSAGGAQSATFNWTFNDAGQFEMGCIGILKAAAAAAANANAPEVHRATPGVGPFRAAWLGRDKHPAPDQRPAPIMPETIAQGVSRAHPGPQGPGGLAWLLRDKRPAIPDKQPAPIMPEALAAPAELRRIRPGAGPFLTAWLTRDKRTSTDITAAPADDVEARGVIDVEPMAEDAVVESDFQDLIVDAPVVQDDVEARTIVDAEPASEDPVVESVETGSPDEVEFQHDAIASDAGGEEIVTESAALEPVAGEEGDQEALIVVAAEAVADDIVIDSDSQEPTVAAVAAADDVEARGVFDAEAVPELEAFAGEESQPPDDVGVPEEALAAELPAEEDLSAAQAEISGIVDQVVAVADLIEAIADGLELLDAAVESLDQPDPIEQGIETAIAGQTTRPMPDEEGGRFVQTGGSRPAVTGGARPVELGGSRPSSGNTSRGRVRH